LWSGPRAIFAERLDDVLHMVRQDRQDLRGWEEPAHLRAVVRRSIRENGDNYESTEVHHRHRNRFSAAPPANRIAASSAKASASCSKPVPWAWSA